MPNDVAVIEESLTAKDIHAQVQRIQQVMEAVMKDGTHYGLVPGCGDKPTLLKAGAEKLMMTFRLAADPEIDDLSKEGVRRYRVRTRITSQSSGVFIGTGVGECSSEEEKYGWRAAVSPAEYEAADPLDRRLKYKYNVEPIRQVRTNPADIANTVLKMAKKRSLVDAILTVTAASDIFTQDIEDMPEGTIEHHSSKSRPVLNLPNYGHHKGQPMNDPTIPLSELKYYLEGAERSLADPAKEKHHANNKKMRDALMAEIARRVSPPEPDQGSAAAQEPPGATPTGSMPAESGTGGHQQPDRSADADILKDEFMARLKATTNVKDCAQVRDDVSRTDLDQPWKDGFYVQWSEKMNALICSKRKA